MKNPNDGRISHGMYGTRIYRIWAAMKRRCYNSNYPEFHLYGGRGIKVCNDWIDFEGFYQWAMNHGYKKDLSIDRINNSGDYESCNCRWVDVKSQANNRRSNVLIHYKGEERTLKEWSEILGIKYKAVWKRVRDGWDIEIAFTKPLKTNKTLR